jgi:hypothetical protein
MAKAQGPSEGADGRRGAAIEAYRSAPTPNVIIWSRKSRGDCSCRPRRPSPKSATPAPRHRDRPRQRRPALPRADPPRRQRLPDRAGRTIDVVRARSPGCSSTRTPSRSAASSRSSAPRAASAPRPSRTTSPGRSRATFRRPSSPISTSPSAPPASTSTRTRRRASPRRCSRRTASTTASSTGCCRSAPTI